jgi:hypothetical protein
MGTAPSTSALGAAALGALPGIAAGLPLPPLKKRGKLMGAAADALKAAAADPVTAAAVAALLASTDLSTLGGQSLAGLGPGGGPGGGPQFQQAQPPPHMSLQAAQQAVLLATTRLLQASAFKVGGRDGVDWPAARRWGERRGGMLTACPRSCHIL